MRENYQELNHIVESAEMPLKLEELHGLLCGMLVVGKDMPATTYIDMVTNRTEDKNTKQLHKVLGMLYEETMSSLQSPTLEFEPLLPGDDYPLDERMEAACSWARGLIIGLAKQGIEQNPNATEVSEDSSSFITDMYQVSQSDVQVAFDDESELIYLELVEYLKMGTLLLQEEFNPVKGEISPTVH